MQALLTWPPSVQTQLGFELAYSCTITTRTSRRRNMLGLGFPVCYGSTAAVSLHSSSSGSIGVEFFGKSPNCSFGWACSKLKLFENSKLKKGSSFMAAWALDEHTSREESGREGGGDNDVESRIQGENVDQKNGNVDVRALASSLRLAKTADDVEEVLKDKGDLPPQVFSSMIRGFGRDKLMDSAIAVVEWLKRKNVETNGLITPNLFIYNSLLGAVKQSRQFAEMDKVLADMVREGVEPNIVTYNTLMAIYVEQELGVRALNVIEEIQMKGLIPSSVTYSTALLAYQRMQDATGALKFFIEFREKYHKGDICKVAEENSEHEFLKLESFTKRICYQVMRRWLVMDEDLCTSVLKLLVKMDNAGVPLGQEEHERLLWACTREEHYTVARELYSRIRERRSDISISVCNHLIWVMGKAKRWWAALEVYEDMLDKGPKPNNMSYELVMSHFNILLTAARKKGIWKWGISLLNKMEEKGLKPRSREYNAVLVACSKAAETSAAVQIFHRMVEQGQKPTIISYGALLSALEKGKLYDEARRVWEHMIKVGIKPNLYAYTTMASVFSGQGKFDMVETIIHEMISSGIEPTVVTYNAIISGCARNDSSSADAYDWFHRMKAHNISPNNITYETLIEALSREGKPRLAYELYVKAQAHGLVLSSKAYDIVIQSSLVSGATIDLKVLGARPPPQTKENAQGRKSCT